MSPGTSVIIHSRLVPVPIGALVERVSDRTGMVYLTDANGGQHVCFSDELHPSPTRVVVVHPQRVAGARVANPDAHRSADMVSHHRRKKRVGGPQRSDLEGLSLTAAAKQIGCAKSLVSLCVSRGELRATRHSAKVIRIEPADLSAWWSSRNHAPGPIKT